MSAPVIIHVSARKGVWVNSEDEVEDKDKYKVVLRAQMAASLAVHRGEPEKGVAEAKSICQAAGYEVKIK